MPHQGQIHVSERDVIRYLPSHLPALTLLSAHHSGRAMTLADQSSVAPCAMLTVRREARSDLVGPCALNAPLQPCKTDETDTGKRLAEVDANDDDSSQTASRSRNKRQRPLVSNDLEPCVATDSATSSAPTRMPAEWKELDRQLRFVVSSCPLPIASSQLPVRLQNVRDRGNCALALMKERTYVLQVSV